MPWVQHQAQSVSWICIVTVKSSHPWWKLSRCFRFRKHFSRLQSSLGLTLYPLPLPPFIWYMALFLCHACTMFYFYFPQDLNSCCHILFPFPKSSRPSASEPIPHCVSFLFLVHEKEEQHHPVLQGPGLFRMRSCRGMALS